ncbi:MAG TPA: sulfite exporter TauE/SafE family protein [Solirubrobacteraceae bacterium]|nr:sulfite exporter TauE/SafE family protein [Solirubrobacteraceae bacterium]
MAHGAEWILLAVAGFAAGTVNGVAGGGSLLSFPALLLVGYGSVAANVTNAIAVLPGYAGGSIAYRRELSGQRERVIVLGAISAAGAVVGAALLLVAPERLFSSLAPWLVLLACAALAARPLLHPGGKTRPRGLLWLLMFVGGIYGGYFGAGLGIMLLALLGAFLPDGMHRLNALRGMMALLLQIAACVVLAAFGPVAWVPAVVMGATSLLGGHFGVGVARRVDENLLRYGVVVYGVAVAALLLVD